jgi:hypothetical protein
MVCVRKASGGQQNKLDNTENNVELGVEAWR